MEKLRLAQVNPFGLTATTQSPAQPAEPMTSDDVFGVLRRRAAEDATPGGR